MPELPEVETIRRSLAGQISGEIISLVTVHNSSLRVPLDTRQLADKLTGREILSLNRRGKLLLLHLNNHWTWIVHFGMTGKLILTRGNRRLLPHTHVQVKLHNGKELRFMDARRFGQMALVPTGKLRQFRSIRDLGPEPFSRLFNASWLCRMSLGRRKKIVDFMMDQKLVAGLGNIYAHEILYRARVRPDREAGTLTQNELSRVVAWTKRILADAIQHGGTSLRDYLDGNGQPGGYQKLLKVYGQQGLPCPRCGSCIVRIGGSRSSFYCPLCQT